MAKQSMRERLKGSLEKRVEQSYKEREGDRFMGIFQDDLPFPMWSCGTGEHIIDILAYLAGPFDPKVGEGYETYVLDVYVHKNIGPNRRHRLCLAKNYDKPCPVCQERDRLRSQEEYDDNLTKAMYPIRYVAYYILCYDNRKEEDTGVQIFYVAHWFMEKHLTQLAKAPIGRHGQKIGGYVAFADPDKSIGRSVRFEKKGKGKGNVSYDEHQLVPRDYEIPASVYDQIEPYPLDSLMYIPTYDELYNEFWQLDDSEQVEGPAPSDDDESYPETHPDEDQPEIVSEPEDQPAEKAEDPALVGRCPAGGVFGRDIENLPECSNCPEWDACEEEADKLMAEARARMEARRQRQAPAQPKAAPPQSRRGTGLPRRR